MTTRQTKISILTLTVLICLAIFYLFFGKSERHEWFSVGILFYYALGLTILYLLILTIIGLITKRFRNKRTGQTILQSTGISFILLGIALSTIFIKSSNDFNQWKLETNKTERTNRELEDQMFQQQLDSLDKVIANSPDNYLVFVQRGLLKRKNGEFEGSISDYEIALKIKPNDFDANLEMGYSLKVLDRTTEAEKYFKIAANIDTNSYFAKTHRHYIVNERKKNK